MQMVESRRGCKPAQKSMCSSSPLAFTSRFSAVFAELLISRHAFQGEHLSKDFWVFIPSNKQTNISCNWRANCMVACQPKKNVEFCQVPTDRQPHVCPPVYLHLHCYPTVCLLLREIATQSRQIMSSEALLLNGFGQNPQKPTSMTLSIRSACASGSRRAQWLQMILTRVVPATASYSARGIGSQASVGAAVDEELRQAGKTCCRHRASGFQASCRL